MYIVTNKKDEKRNFETLDIGTPFTWRDGYYMKIQQCLVKSELRNAVDLVNGTLVYFDSNYSISCVPMAVHVAQGERND